MTQDEKWMVKCKEVDDFITSNKRNPSKYNDTERGLYCNWIRHNKKLLKAGTLKADRIELFTQLLSKMEEHKRLNQYM